MMISIDGRTLPESTVRGETLEEILADLQENHLPANHLIGEVRLNGVVYTEDLPHAAVEVSRPGIETLEIISHSPEELAQHFLKHGSALVGSLVESLPKIVELFRLGDEAEANEHFLRFLESLHLLVATLDQVGLVLGLQFNIPVGDQVSTNERLKKLAGALSQMLEVQEQMDWIYLADLLQYELTPELEALRDLLPNLSKTAH
ncbi:MAG: hypothetical protein AB1641_10675 [Thermodesulfobacteriota bacterium]